MSESAPPIASLGPALIAAGSVTIAIGAIGLGVMIAKHRPAPAAAAPAAAERIAERVVAVPASVEEEEPILTLRVPRVRAVPAADDPHNPVWDLAPSVQAPLHPQMLTVPMLEHATLDTAQVQALSDGQNIAWRVSWKAASPAVHSDVGQYSDAAGLQFPLVEGASYMMGDADPNRPVHVLYWRAQWQQDIDHGFQDVATLYPNFFSCGYWFAEGDFPPRVPGSFSDSRSHAWFVAYEAGNPMADFHRSNPAEEMTAAGVGTVTHLPDSPSTARGVWREDMWAVVFVRPLVDDDLSRLFQQGRQSMFGVAVWDGSAGNVGARKHHSYWIPFEVEP